MSLPQLILAALAASAVVVSQPATRTVGSVALGASALETLFVFDLVRFSVRGLDVGFLLAASLAVAGLLAWSRGSSRPAVTAATTIALIGAVQVLGRVI